MPPLAVGDKVLVQNQTGRAPNKWDKSGVIIECKPHNQVNVMMDGSRKVSLRNRQFVRKMNVPMPISVVKPSQFYSAQSDDVDDVQHHRGKDSSMVEHGQREQLLENTDKVVNTDDEGTILVDDLVTGQDRVEIEDGEGCVANDATDQPPVMRSQRMRKPNSKYDPAVYDLDSVEIRGIPLSGKKNGWKGIYWPK